MLALAVVEQAVIDYRVSLEARVIHEDGKVRPIRVKRVPLPTMLIADEVRSLRPFLFRGGLEKWLFAFKLRVNASSIRRGLKQMRKSFKRSCHEGYLNGTQQGIYKQNGTHKETTGENQMEIELETPSLLLRDAQPGHQTPGKTTLEAFLKARWGPPCQEE
jgi:hypothetical protein